MKIITYNLSVMKVVCVDDLFFMQKKTRDERLRELQYHGISCVIL